MARLLTLVVDLDTLPAAIADSARAVLNAHRGGKIPGMYISDVDPADLEALLRELGRNVAQAVVLADAREDGAE